MTQTHRIAWQLVRDMFLETQNSTSQGERKTRSDKHQALVITVLIPSLWCYVLCYAQ